MKIWLVIVGTVVGCSIFSYGLASTTITEPIPGATWGLDCGTPLHPVTTWASPGFPPGAKVDVAIEGCHRQVELRRWVALAFAPAGLPLAPLAMVMQVS